MINLLARKCRTGDVYINLAARHLLDCEWGLARKAVEAGLKKGALADPGAAANLLHEICERMGEKPASW